MNITTKNILKSLVLLYIEDEDTIRANMTDTLSIIFKKVVAFDNAQEAYVYYQKNDIDIIISDINLPGMSGIEFTKLIRKENFKIPIILLTAYSQTSILLEATRLKLVNYITKPIVYEDLYDSLEVAVEEIARYKNKVILFDNNIKYDLSSKILYKDNAEIHLTASEIKLLDILVEGLPKTVPLRKIKERLWKDQSEATRSAMKSVLTKLRSKIGKQHIKNVSGVGYYLVAIIELDK
jgi:DNA-binding response OmpR family regulator